MTMVKYSFATMGLLAMWGCSTPQPALDQANHGVALVSQMELELKEFRKSEEQSERFLLGSIVRQQKAAIALTQDLRTDDLAREAIGTTRANQIITKMTAFVQGLADNDRQAIAEQKAVDDAMAKLLAPLPSTAAAITETQAKFAVMGKELSWSDRQAELKALAKEVQKNVKDNKKKIEEAKAALASKLTP
jgi:hypothetical protein